MKKLLLILFAAMTVSALAADTTVKGYLVDRECASELGSRAGFGPNHSKSCLQMPPCEKSGYAVLTEDKKIIKLDDKGKPMEIGLRAGDTVYYGKYSGTDVEVDGEKFVILRESDVLGVLE